MKKSILRLIAAVLMAGLVVGLMTFASSASGETEGAPIAGTLGVKAQLRSGITSDSETADLRIITTLDSANYSSAGFFITVGGNEQRVDLKAVYSSIKADDGTVYKPSDVSDTSAFFLTYVLTGIPNSAFDTAINVVPFTQSFEGTVVRGTGRDIVIGDQFPEAPKEDSEYVKYVKSLYPDYKESEYGLDITFKDDIVGICYSTWHDYAREYNYGTIYDLSKILAGNGSYGPTNYFHYWSEPALGYYSNMDETVIRTHMTQLSNAGVDFIVLDNTNITTDSGWTSTTVGNSGISGWDLYSARPAVFLLETCLKMRAEGLDTPYVVFWNRNVEGWNVCNKIYDDIVSLDKYKDLWVYWRVDANGLAKPLMLGTGMTDVGTTDYGAMYDSPVGKITLAKKFNYRTMWGLQNSETQNWSFLNNTVNNPRHPIKDTATGNVYYEQICVCAAAQANYMSNPSATSRKHGVTFYKQWLQAFKYRPKIVILTWWNEWVAQRQPNGGFVDLYSPEYSRDLEPMKGGFGDQYYQWMIQYISAYKNHKDCPRLVEAGY